MKYVTIGEQTFGFDFVELDNLVEGYKILPFTLKNGISHYENMEVCVIPTYNVTGEAKFIWRATADLFIELDNLGWRATLQCRSNDMTTCFKYLKEFLQYHHTQYAEHASTQQLDVGANNWEVTDPDCKINHWRKVYRLEHYYPVEQWMGLLPSGSKKVIWERDPIRHDYHRWEVLDLARMIGKERYQHPPQMTVTHRSW